MDANTTQFRVKSGYHLHLPEEIRDRNRGWLKPGQTLDASAPGVAELLEGQEYKLEPLPEGEKGAPLADPRVKKFVEMRARATKVQAPTPQTLAARTRARRVTSKIPDPDSGEST